MLAVLGGVLGAGEIAAAPVNAVFTVNQATTVLTVQVESRGFTDSDRVPLAGTLNATLDFGTSGAFAATAAMTVTGADINAVGNLEFRLGFRRPFPGADVVASGIGASVTTIEPPATLTRQSAAGVAYRFDASEFLITGNEGVIDVTGFFEDTSNLAEEPVTGVSPVGTFGSLTLTPGATTGHFTLVNASLALPINITDIAEFGEDTADPEEVVLDLDSMVNATASFYVALAGVPGDFDGDNDVDGADLGVWRGGFGTATGADASDGDADRDGDVDGNDFVLWQRNLGTRPPTAGGAMAAVPEPGMAALLAPLVLVGARRLRRRG